MNMQEFLVVGSIRNIIMQTGQFDCIRDTIAGQYNMQNIYNMNPTNLHYSIVDWAIAGNKLNEVGESLWYLNPFSTICENEFPRNGSRDISY